MIPISRQNNLRGKKKTLMFIGVVFFCALVLAFTPTRGIISRIIYQGAPSFFTAGDVVRDSVNVFLGSFQTNSSLVRENTDLHEEINRMQAQVLDRNLLEERVQMLEEMLGRTHRDNRVVGTVISAPWQSPYDTLIIDEGENVSIHTDDLVVYAGSLVIGRVAEVYPFAAKITLFSSPQETDISILVGESNLPARAQGRGMGNFETRIPHGSKISVGSKVLLAEDPTVILGVVESVEEKESTPFIRVLFRTPFNITELRSVEVLTGSNHRIPGMSMKKS